MFKDEYGDIVPAIVSEELWGNANHIFKMRSDMIKHRRSSYKEDNLFTGKIICSDDGMPYWLKERYDRKGNNNSRWVCSHKLKNGTSSCKSFAILERELLDILLNVFQELSGNFDEVINRFVHIYEKSVQFVDYNTKIQKIFEEIDKITQKKDKILEYNLDGKISDNEFLRRNDFFNKDLEKLETEIKSLKHQQDTEKLKLEEIYNIRKNLNNFKIINKEDLNQNIINLFIDKIYAEPIDQRHMNLKIVLSIGETQNRIYEKISKSENNYNVRWGCMFKNIYPERNKEFLRNLRSCDGHTYAVTYSYCVAI